MHIFIGPALLDLIVFLVLFAVSYGAGERGLTMGQCAWLGGIFQLTYMAGSLVTGSLLNRRNAYAMVLAGTVTSIAGAVVCLLTRNFVPTLAAMAGFGVVAALFFNSFQAFMRGQSPPGGLAKATAWYTLAWSCGSSLGFLGSGSLYRFGPVALAGLTLVVGAIFVVILVTNKTRSHDLPSAEEHVEQGPAGSRPVQSVYVWVGWITVFTAMFVQRPLQTFYPAWMAQYGVAPVLVGFALFLHMLAQGVAGRLMAGARHWLYRRFPFLVLQTAAALVFLLMWRVPTYGVSLVGVTLLGLWAGYAYFCAVYYASNAGNRSRNIGINEFLVGLGSFGGLFVSEWFMRRFHSDAAMYAVCAGALLVSTALQWVVASARRRDPE